MILKIGDKVTFHGSLCQDIPAQPGMFTVELFEPAGSFFNQPMAVLEELKDGWIPASAVKLCN